MRCRRGTGGRVRYAAMQLLHNRGEDEMARADFIRARDAFAAMGAARDRVLAEQLL